MGKISYRNIVLQLNNEEHDGGYWLPNIQRPFVWSESQIEKFYDSLMRQYPIGTMLFWKTKSSIKRRKFIDNYKASIKLSEYYVPEDDKRKTLVLDGQQRLQSLFIGLKGSFESKELCFNVLSGDRQDQEEIRYKFKFIKNSLINYPWVKLKDIVFNNDSYHKISKKLIEKFDYQLSEDELEILNDNVANIIKIFVSEENAIYQLVDDVGNPDLYTEEDNVEIFIRANSGGTPLGKSDLLFSLLSSSWDEADENMEDLLDEINRTGFQFTRDFVLKCCLSILNKGASYRVEKFRKIETKQDIIDKWVDISNAIKEVKDYIYSKTFIKTHATLPSYLVLIPLIYFRYHYPEKWNSVSNINSYLLRTLLAGAFSGNPDSLIDKCVNKIKETDEFEVDEIFTLIKSDGRNLDITKNTILKSYYGSKELHLLFNLWYDFNYEPSYNLNKPQVDHIFPQSVLKKQKVANENTGRLDVLKYKWFDRDQIANCMLLTARENGAGGKSDITPEVWFADKDDAYLDLHLIPKNKELWKLENFENFISERQILIEEKFKSIIIKD